MSYLCKPTPGPELKPGHPSRGGRGIHGPHADCIGGIFSLGRLEPSADDGRELVVHQLLCALADVLADQRAAVLKVQALARPHAAHEQCARVVKLLVGDAKRGLMLHEHARLGLDGRRLLGDGRGLGGRLELRHWHCGCGKRARAWIWS